MTLIMPEKTNAHAWQWYAIAVFDLSAAFTICYFVGAYLHASYQPTFAECHTVHSFGATR